ncbi:hypothetical protein GCM10028825_51180 [Spirosoma agri]
MKRVYNGPVFFYDVVKMRAGCQARSPNLTNLLTTCHNLARENAIARKVTIGRFKAKGMLYANKYA